MCIFRSHKGPLPEQMPLLSAAFASVASVSCFCQCCFYQLLLPMLIEATLLLILLIATIKLPSPDPVLLPPCSFNSI